MNDQEEKLNHITEEEMHLEEILKKDKEYKEKFDELLNSIPKSANDLIHQAPKNINENPKPRKKLKNKKNKSYVTIIEKKSNKLSIPIIIPALIIVLLIGAFVINKKHDLKDIVELNFFKSGLEIEKVELEDNKLNISFAQPKNLKKRWFKVMSENEDLMDWTEISQENKIDVNENIKYIQIKDEKNESEKFDITDFLNVIYELNVKTTLDKIMLTKGEIKVLQIDTKQIGNPDKTINISTSDPAILKVEDKTITALEPGKVTLTVSDNYNHKIEIPVTSTDLISLPEMPEDKPFLLSGYVYTEEEAHLLDEILDYKVKEAGEGTRAAVVAVAKFMTMEFKYRLPYFFENGRYQKNEYSVPCDGEGRYYHKGMYLSEDKYQTIKDSRFGPAMWGAPLFEASTKTTQHNGLDCSGFVSWALYNAGFDPGDIGAGPDNYFATIPGYGKEYDLTVDILRSRNN